MAHSSEDSPPYEQDDILFQAAYGGMPKFFLYRVIPLFVLAAGVLFVIADLFNGGIFMVKGVQLSPERVRLVVCPAMLLMCAVVLVLEVYRRLHPQRIVVTKDGLRLPKGRFTAEIIDMRWNDLKAIFVSTGSIYEVYEVTCVDGLHGTKARIASVLFRDFDDFATFALIIGEFVGEDWSIKGFLPGKFRGSQEQARRASRRIQSSEDA